MVFATRLAASAMASALVRRVATSAGPTVTPAIVDGSVKPISLLTRGPLRTQASGAAALLPAVPRANFHTASKVCRAAAEETAMAARTGLVATIMGFPKAQPFAFNIIIATVKTSAADLMTQVMVEGKAYDEVDWVRNGVFVVFGASYLGGFQYWLQINMFKKMFPNMQRFANQSFAAKLKDTPGQIDTVKQVFFDVFVHLPFMYFPTFYAVKESVQGSSWSPMDWVQDGCIKYYNNFKADFTKMFMVWFPSDIVIFAVPLYLRLPMRHIVSFAWTAYLSFLRGGKTAET